MSSPETSAAASSGPDMVVTDPHAGFAASLLGTRIGGRYVVDKVLGKGGMGLVVSAHYADLEQKVAIKVMFPEHAASATHAKRFMREAKVAAKLRSPNLVRVTDIGTLDSGIPFLVMELLEGKDLDRELAERGALPPEEAVHHVLQAATGLAELHALGIVHRDLKPGNLFLAETAGGRELKILDYGISKDAASPAKSLTVTDALIGTPSHMSPEQIKTPKEVDSRSDIWALGVILYELLAYKLPFELEGSTVGELFGLILFSDPIPLRQRRPEISEELEAVVMKCLRRERTERWATVAELAEALAPFASAEERHRVAAIAKVMANAPSSPAIPVAIPTPVEIPLPKAPAPSEKATVVSGPARVERVGDVVEAKGANAVSSPGDLLARTALAGATDVTPEAIESAPRPMSAPAAPPRSRAGLVIGGVVSLALFAGGATLALRASTPTPSGVGLTATPSPSASPTSVTLGGEGGHGQAAHRARRHGVGQGHRPHVPRRERAGAREARAGPGGHRAHPRPQVAVSSVASCPRRRPSSSPGSPRAAPRRSRSRPGASSSSDAARTRTSSSRTLACRAVTRSFAADRPRRSRTWGARTASRSRARRGAGPPVRRRRTRPASA